MSTRFDPSSYRPDIPVWKPSLTLTHSADTTWSEIAQTIGQAAVQDLVSFGLKDRYAGEGVPVGAVNTTIYFLYNAADSSLTRDEK